MAPEATALEWAAQLGFPVAAAGFLLLWLTRSLNGKLDRLTRGLLSATRAIHALTERIEEMQRDEAEWRLRLVSMVPPIARVEPSEPDDAASA